MILPNDGNFAGVTFELTMFPSKTYNMDGERGRISGYTDDIEAVKQSVFRILNTERYAYGAYSRNYGVELQNLIGMPVAYCLPEIKRCITEALTWDSRIDSVDNFEFVVNKGKVHCKFTVHTIFGDLTSEKAVVI